MANNFNPNVAWSDDEVGSTDKLNEMVDNMNIVYNLVPHYMHRQGETGLKDFNESQSRVLKPVIFSGRVGLNAKGKKVAQRSIAWPSSTFAPACQPVVLAQIATSRADPAILNTRALDGARNIKSDGFRVYAQRLGSSSTTFGADVSIHYMAFGWQEA